MSNKRTIEHTVKLIAEFDTEKMPLDIAYLLMQVGEEQLNSILAQTFVASIDHIGGLDKINANAEYATIKWGNN
jgi:hypothetical protein